MAVCTVRIVLILTHRWNANVSVGGDNDENGRFSQLETSIQLYTVKPYVCKEREGEMKNEFFLLI